MRKYSYLYISILFIIGYIFVFRFLYLNRIKEYLSERTRELELAYTSVQESYKIPAQVYFSTVINTPKVLSIMHDAWFADLENRNRLRDSLLGLLSASYEELKELNYRQLHFHFKNNVSFLRFHRPAKFGDNLTNIRSTIKYVNQHIQYAQGFEEGRIFNGFRYVFPLIFQEEHIGSVELSNEFSAIVENLEKNHAIIGDFMILKEEVENNVFESERLNYYTSPFSKKFLMESMAIEKMKHKDIDGISYLEMIENTKKIKQISKYIENFSSISFTLDKLNEPIIVTFLPLKNFDMENVAYFIIYQKDEKLTDLKKDLFIAGIISLIFSWLLLIFFAAIVYSREKILAQNLKINDLAEELKSKNRALNESETVLIDMNKQLKNINETKDKFFSIIAHDLKNPFHAIIGLSQILTKHLKDENNVRDFEISHAIYQSAVQTYGLLENLLQWAATQTGKIHYEIKEISLNMVISKIIDFTKLNAESKEIEIINEIKTLVFVQADVNLLETVLRNLMTNAIKFTPEKGRIKISMEQKELLEISVCDTGIGMKKEFAENIFINPGAQKNKGTKGETGSGLGLIICKEFIHLMGGKIWVKTAPGKGSTFTFSIPYK